MTRKIAVWLFACLAVIAGFFSMGIAPGDFPRTGVFLWGNGWAEDSISNYTYEQLAQHDIISIPCQFIDQVSHPLYAGFAESIHAINDSCKILYFFSNREIHWTWSNRAKYGYYPDSWETKYALKMRNHYAYTASGRDTFSLFAFSYALNVNSPGMIDSMMAHWREFLNAYTPSYPWGIFVDFMSDHLTTGQDWLINYPAWRGNIEGYENGWGVDLDRDCVRHRTSGGVDDADEVATYQFNCKRMLDSLRALGDSVIIIANGSWSRSDSNVCKLLDGTNIENGSVGYVDSCSIECGVPACALSAEVDISLQFSNLKNIDKYFVTDNNGPYILFDQARDYNSIERLKRLMAASLLRDDCYAILSKLDSLGEKWRGYRQPLLKYFPATMTAPNDDATETSCGAGGKTFARDFGDSTLNYITRSYMQSLAEGVYSFP